MKFYRQVVLDGDVWAQEFSLGEWATRADAEQLEKERNAYRDECITRGGRELQALCDKERAAQDAVRMAQLAQQAIYELYDGKAAHTRDPRYVEAQAIKERYGEVENGSK